jgi:hypothetical protein
LLILVSTSFVFYQNQQKIRNYAKTSCPSKNKLHRFKLFSMNQILTVLLKRFLGRTKLSTKTKTGDGSGIVSGVLNKFHLNPILFGTPGTIPEPSPVLVFVDNFFRPKIDSREPCTGHKWKWTCGHYEM